MTLLSGLLAHGATLLWLGGTLLALLVGAVWRGRQSAARDAARRSLAQDLANRRVRDAVDRDVAQRGDAARRLHDDWRRY
jgi:hypothetical protein